MEEIIKKMFRLWDPYHLISFPKDEYDTEAKKIFEFINNSDSLTISV